MPLKPIFDKAPLTAMTAQPLQAGLVRTESPAMKKLYAIAADANAPEALEGVFRLACIVSAKPGEEPAAEKIRALLSAQKADGSFDMSIMDSVATLRAAWALYEFEARKPLLDHIARWCAYAAKNWEAVMADDNVWAYSADLLELLENLYRVTGKAAVLNLCERAATQTMGWSSVLNTVNSQRPTSKVISREELTAGIANEHGARDGYYTHFYYANHAASLADGARSTMAKGWYSGSATELNATRNGWERLYRHHGAVCGGLTADEMLEGTTPAAAISTAALGAWAEALAVAAMNERADWAFNALERMVFNAMPASLQHDKLLSFQRVNTLTDTESETDCFCVSPAHANKAMNRMVRGYAAVASAAVTVRTDGAAVNLYLPGRYAIPVGEELLILDISASASGANIHVHAKKEIRTALRLRMPAWSRNVEVTINGADNHGEVKNEMMSFERTWHEGDVIVLRFEQTLSVLDGHHQGKYVLCGPVLMALPAQSDWKKAFVSAEAVDNRVVAMLDTVKEWKVKDELPADLPVMPATEETPSEYALLPYARTSARIAMFPGRKQA